MDRVSERNLNYTHLTLLYLLYESHHGPHAIQEAYTIEDNGDSSSSNCIKDGYIMQNEKLNVELKFYIEPLEMYILTEHHKELCHINL